MKTTSAVKKALGKLPKTLEESYDVIYSQMLDTDPETLRKAETVMRWLLCGKRQLRTSEFIGAVCASSCSSEGTSPVGADDDPLSVEEILDICCNLVVWDQGLDTFRTAHLSVREYFERKPHFEKRVIHAQAIEACLDTLIEQINQQKTTAFKLYATTYWPNHCFDVGLEGPAGELRNKVMFFLFQGSQASGCYLDWIDSLNLSSLEKLGQDSSTWLEFDQSMRLLEADSALSHPRDVISGQRSILFLASAFNLPWILTQLSSLDYFLTDTISTKRSNGDSAITIAAVWGSKEVVHQLLDHGINADTKGFKGWTPLHRVAQNGRQLLAKDLIKRGANVNAVSGDGRQFTPLHEAIWNAHPAMVDLLLEHGADVEARDSDRLTPLLLAVKEGKEDIVPVLLKWNADMSAKDRNGDSAFFLAAERHEPIFLQFIRNGRIPESLFDGSALCSAVRSCSRKSVQTLLEKGIDVNAPDRLGRRPLDYALEQGLSQVISLLVGHGACAALNWNASSYHIEQWKSETWFPELVKTLACSDSVNSAPYIWGLIPTKVYREDFIAVSEDSPQVPYLWIRIPDSFTFVSRIIFTTESHDQGWTIA
jgi:ankyrin repeat protein